MDNIRKKVNEEMVRGWVGPNHDCPYHPAHFAGQDCSFCYCPFFPCNDDTFGKNIEGRHGDVWDCSPCLFIHRTPVVKFIFSEIERLGIKDASDPRFSDIFADAKKRFWKKGKAVMVVGATSNAGKSTTVAALCRIFHRMGYLVAPFKSQNMSLNSRVTMYGSEIAGAQAFQAKAAGLTNPDHHMNPILLKPKGDSESQVIVRGTPFGDYDTKRYYDDFVPNEGFSIVKEEIEYLKDRYDYVIMEGAGSPAEINIYDKDISNMRAADIADADVILVVNVGRGGSFAYALGTLELMPEDDRKRVKGIVLNDISGDPESMRSGAEELERRAGIPVIGIIPRCDLILPNEDSENLVKLNTGIEGKPVIGVIRFPHIAYFTDLEPLMLEDVSIRLIERKEDLDGIDAIILPGTKNTIMDYDWMTETGLSDVIKSLWKKIPVLGICGGYQMMGKIIDDSDGIASGESCRRNGLGMFDSTTKYNLTRTARTDNGELLHGGKGDISGFEIHLGSTETEEEPLFSLEKFGSAPVEEGSVRESDKTFGTYLHGIFEMPAFRSYFLSFVENAGPSSGLDYNDVIEDNIEGLADLFEKNMDMDALKSIFGVTE